MKNRRSFLVQSTLATTAMFALKPLTGIGKTLSQLTGFGIGNDKLALLHTAHPGHSSHHKVISHIQHIKNNNRNAILLNASPDVQDKTGPLQYDASMNAFNDLSARGGDYKIITKGNTRTGIISAKPGENNVIQKIKTLSAWLKEEKKCTLVVCLSQLGFKNQNSPDDITLAKESAHLDIIIGGHAENFYVHPTIVLNRDNSEVIIHSAPGDSFAWGQIEIDFDRQGRKNKISFADQSSKDISSGRAIPAA